jgi:hypothetical protein
MDHLRRCAMLIRQPEKVAIGCNDRESILPCIYPDRRVRCFVRQTNLADVRLLFF